MITKRIGPRGVVVGIDLQAVAAVAGAVILQGDLAAATDAMLTGPTRGEAFDLILSDMAPNTSGDRTIDHYGSARLVTLVLDRARTLLRPGGSLVAKVLEGETYPELLARCRAEFAAVKGFKPKASRSESTEMFIVATERRA